MDDDRIKCNVCGKKLWSVYPHLRTHNITVEEYLELYPLSKLLSDTTLKKQNDMKLKNPDIHKYMKGKKHTDDSKKKMSESIKIAWSKRTDRRPATWKPRINKTCEECGKTYEIEERNQHKTKYCSKKCRFLNDSRIYSNNGNPNWKGGISPERQGMTSNRKWKIVSKNVLNRDNHKCQKCNADKLKLHIHHIIPIENELYRFEETNLVTLCTKCHGWVHSKENTYREFLHTAMEPTI